MSRTKQTSQAGLREVAASAGVSLATASRVLNGIAGRASGETARRVREAAERLAYRPVAAGRELRRGQGELVALLAPNLANPTMAAIAAAIETALREEGVSVVLSDTHDRADLLDAALAAMASVRPRATVIVGALRSTGLAAARARGERLLFVSRRCPDAAEAPFVGIDDAAAGAEVAQALLAAGCRRLAVIHGPAFSSATMARVAGFAQAAGRHLAQSRILGPDGLDHLEIGARAAARLAAAPPDGLMCTSDLIAFAAHRAMEEARLPLPRIWGFDGGPLNRWVAPWLSSVGLPFAAFGEAARDWVLQRPGAEGGRVLPHTLLPAAQEPQPRPAAPRSISITPEKSRAAPPRARKSR
jgi:LacI family transcriptional regulator